MDIPALNTLGAAGFAAPPPTATGSSGAAANSSPARADRSNQVSTQALQATNQVQPSRQELDKAVKAVNDFVSTVNTDLKFSVDDETGQTIVKVIDVATEKVIKQYPSEEMLAIAKALDSIKGLLIQQKA